MSVTKIIVAAFDQAARTHRSLHEPWTRVSIRLGGTLPKSLLMSSVQRDGTLDMVLRCMEDERVARAQASEPDGMFDFHYQRMLSEIWIGSVYETLRLIVERNPAVATEDVRALANDFRLLRVTLEKHEIAKETRCITRTATSPAIDG
jgi:hypothetical protein